jgi:single-strand DNA-binding protein
MNLNRVTLAGRLTRDPEMRQLPSGASVCSFGLAVNKKWKDKAGEWQEDTLFIDVEAWGRTGEFVAERARKGMHALVDGALQMKEWTSKGDGQKRTKILVNAQTVQCVDVVKNETRAAPQAAAHAAPSPGGWPRGTATTTTSNPRPPDDDIPF